MDLPRALRFPVHFHSVFVGPKLSESVGTVVNLSEGGCCIHTDRQIYVGIQLTLHLHLPDEASPIRIEQAEVRWNRGRELGLGFITVAPSHQDRLGKLLARLQRVQELEQKGLRRKGSNLCAQFVCVGGNSKNE